MILVPVSPKSLCTALAKSAIVEASDREQDPQVRAELLHQAEQRAVGEQFYIIPLYAMKSVNLVSPDITGIRQIPASGALEYRYAERM